MKHKIQSNRTAIQRFHNLYTLLDFWVIYKVVNCLTPFSLLKLLAGFMILMYLFETYLDLRQHAALKLPTLPKTLEGVITQEKFEKSRAYSLDKRCIFSQPYCCRHSLFFFISTSLAQTGWVFFRFSHFHFVHEFVTILMDSAILFFGILPWFWKVIHWLFCGSSLFIYLMGG